MGYKRSSTVTVALHKQNNSSDTVILCNTAVMFNFRRGYVLNSLSLLGVSLKLTPFSLLSWKLIFFDIEQKSLNRTTDIFKSLICWFAWIQDLFLGQRVQMKCSDTLRLSFYFQSSYISTKFEKIKLFGHMWHEQLVLKRNHSIAVSPPNQLAS